MRVLIPSGSGAGTVWAVGQRLTLDDNEAHHLRVRRAKSGEPVEILDGAGVRGAGRLVDAGKQWLVEIEALKREPRPSDLTLAVAAGDRDRFFWMVEKAVELAVTAIVPLETARSAGVATRIKEAHLGRLRRHAVEATKQCGAAWSIQIEEPIPLATFLKREVGGTRWLADRSGNPVASQLDQSPVTVVIGPEGGLTEVERSALEMAGYLPVILGPHTLRFETAALAAAAAASIARMRGSHG